MLPNKNNLCAGAYPDWLDISLMDRCNGKCEWCIEKIWNYKPLKRVSWKTLSKRIIEYGKNNVVFTGGEPTLYKDIKKLIDVLHDNNFKVHVNTNGSKLTDRYVSENLTNIFTINISIHHWDLKKNKEITGVNLKKDVLIKAIKELTSRNIITRLTCNLIKVYIDSVDEIKRYIEFAKEIGATDIRFCELSFHEDIFVDAAKLMNYQYGLNDEPFTKGCCFDVVIDNMPVRFKQVCGVMTDNRVFPDKPEKVCRPVLYYDGTFHDTWEMLSYTDDYLEGVIEGVMSGDITAKQGALIL